MSNTTENNILSTARRHFVTYGYAGARMQEIADEAGINKALLHYYFRSKEKLYTRILDDILDTVLPRIASALGNDHGLWEKIESMLDSYFHILREEPDIPFFLLSELSQRRERFIVALQSRARYFPSFHTFIRDLAAKMEAGEIRAFHPLQLFLNLISMIVFPFIAKPVFTTIFDMPDKTFNDMMAERKGIILEFMKNALVITPSISSPKNSESL